MNSAALRIDRIAAWTERREERGRREWRQRLIGSVVGHVLVAIVVIWAPSPAPSPLPKVVTVNLVGAAPRVAPKRAPAPREQAPAPKPVMAPPPVQKKKVLPTEAPTVRAKPKPPVERPAEPELDYEDALSRLRNDAGETAPGPEAEEVLDAEPVSGGAGQVNPELAAWQSAVDRRLQLTWVTPAEFRNTALHTLLVVRLMADGTVLGSPRVKRSSGNPSYDDNAVRGVIQASPLPPPPEAGDWPIVFKP